MRSSLQLGSMVTAQSPLKNSIARVPLELIERALASQPYLHSQKVAEKAVLSPSHLQ